MNLGKMQVKGVTMATSHGSPPLGFCHTDLSVENKEHKRTYPRPEHRSFEEPRGGWEGMNKMQNAARQLQASHEGKTTWQWLECTCAKQSPADNRKSPS